eukprot:SAG31_NODE_5197_length_2682_cov_15.276810_3_plen_85_part_00
MPLPAAGGHEGSQQALGGLTKLWLGTDLQFWRSGAPLPSHFPCNLEVRCIHVANNTAVYTDNGLTRGARAHRTVPPAAIPDRMW